MLDEALFKLLGLLEGLGIASSIVAWIVVAAGAGAMAFALRRERRRSIWIGAGAAGAIALIANLADYYVTLHVSPDLGMESNPLWRNVVDRWGLPAAKIYGLSGKIFVSILAAQMFAFYLSNVQRLFPARARSMWEFLRRMGDRSKNPGDRALALFTLFAFLFTGVQLLYFYIAYLNWAGESVRLPSVPLAILLLIAALGATFASVSYRAFLRRESA